MTAAGSSGAAAPDLVVSDADFLCVDCGEQTLLREYYMVTREVWEQTGFVGHDGMLCVGCLEGRIGRPVTAGDLTACPVNVPMPHDSPRLVELKKAMLDRQPAPIAAELIAKAAIFALHHAGAFA